MDIYAINRDPDLLMPLVKIRLLNALSRIRKQGDVTPRLFEGFRTPERQNALYSQGRENTQKIVTNAKAWQSFHNFGLAVDIVGQKPDGTWTWAIDYKPIIAEFKKEGFKNLMPYETCHFEINFGLSIKDVHLLYIKYGYLLELLWHELEKKIAP